MTDGSRDADGHPGQLHAGPERAQRPPVQPGGARADRCHRPRPGPRRRPAAVHPDPGRDVRPGPDRRRGRLRGAHRGRVPGRPPGRVHLRGARGRRRRTRRRVRRGTIWRLRRRAPAARPSGPAPGQPDHLRPAARPGRPRPDLRTGLDPGHAAGRLAGPAAARSTCAISSPATCAAPAGLPSTRRTSSCSRASATRSGRSPSPAGWPASRSRSRIPATPRPGSPWAEAGAVIRPVPVDDDGIKARGPARQRPGLLRHAGPPVPARRPDAGAPPGRPARLGQRPPARSCWKTTTTASSATTCPR